MNTKNKTKKGRPYVKPDKKYGSPDELLKWIKESKKPKEIHRYMAIRMILLDNGRTELEKIGIIFGVSGKTIHRWIELWNKGGKKELILKSKPGRPVKFSKEHEEIVKELINSKEEKEGKRLNFKGVRNFLKERT